MELCLGGMGEQRSRSACKVAAAMTRMLCEDNQVISSDRMKTRGGVYVGLARPGAKNAGDPKVIWLISHEREPGPYPRNRGRLFGQTRSKVSRDSICTWDQLITNVRTGICLCVFTE